MEKAILILTLAKVVLDIVNAIIKLLKKTKVENRGKANAEYPISQI